MDFLRRESVKKRQRACQAKPSGDSVSVRYSPSMGAGFAGLQSCGSVTCPHCGSKIAAKRRDDINKGVCSWRAAGNDVLFGTFTLRHTKQHSFDFLQSAIAKCWAAVTGGRGWLRDLREHGIRGTLRVWETTHNDKNGWHVHVHFLLFVDGLRAEMPGDRERQGERVQALLRSMFARWGAAAKRLGLGAPNLRGQDLHVVTGHDVDVLGGYFAKQVGADDNMGDEMSGGPTKTRGGSRSPRQILDASYREDAAELDAGSMALWNEYELGMQGRRTIAWSKGLRDLLGLDDELTDQEIADQEAEDAESACLILENPEWSKVVRYGLRGDLLEKVSTLGAELAKQWLANRGVESWLPGERENTKPEPEQAPFDVWSAAGRAISNLGGFR